MSVPGRCRDRRESREKDEERMGNEGVCGDTAAAFSPALSGLRWDRTPGRREGVSGMSGQTAAVDAALVYEMREKTW